MIKTIFTFLLCVLSLASTAYAQDQWTIQDVSANPSEWRQVSPEDLVLMRTTKGNVVIELAEDFSPRHVARIREILRQGLYDGTTFHRVISDFMAQGGDISVIRPEVTFTPIQGEFTFRRDPDQAPMVLLNKDLFSEPFYAGYVNGFAIASKQEDAAAYTKDGKVMGWMPHCPGIASMARTNDPNSATDQFFLMRAESPSLDQKYTPWGRMIFGAEVARALNLGEPPEQPDVVISARLVSDLPETLRPTAYVMRNESASFAQIIADHSDVDTICNAPSTPSVVVFP